MDWWTYIAMGVPLGLAVISGGVVVIRNIAGLVQDIRSGRVTVEDALEAASQESVDLTQQSLELAELVAHVVRKQWVSPEDIAAIERESEDVAEVFKRISDLARAVANSKGQGKELNDVLTYIANISTGTAPAVPA